MHPLREKNPYLETGAEAIIDGLKEQLQSVSLEGGIAASRDRVSGLLKQTAASQEGKGHGLQGREVNLIAVSEILANLEPGDPKGIALAEATLEYMPNAGAGAAGEEIRAWIEDDDTRYDKMGMPSWHEARDPRTDSRTAVDGWGVKRMPQQTNE